MEELTQANIKWPRKCTKVQVLRQVLRQVQELVQMHLHQIKCRRREFEESAEPLSFDKEMEKALESSDSGAFFLLGSAINHGAVVSPA